jgi:hypothetical protein
MHAVLVNVSMPPDRAGEGVEHLRANVVPAVKQAPGVVGGYWVSAAEDGKGRSVLLFENEESARAAADFLPNAPRPDFVRIDKVDVREVVAHF